MSEHVHLELVDYVEGRLRESRVREIDAHVAICSECNDDLAWVREFRAAAVQQGLRHLAPERILQIADGLGERTSENEKRHLGSCAECAKEVAWARKHSQPEERPASIFDRLFTFRWGAGALAAAAAAVALFFFVNPRGSAPDFAALARHDPLPVRTSRGDAEPGSFEESQMRGLESYANGDYASARASFQHAAELRPDDAETALYLGSSVRLLGNVDEAATLLRRAVDSTENPTVRDAALWELANALLAAGRTHDAEAALHEVITLSRTHREDAVALLDAMKTTSR